VKIGLFFTIKNIQVFGKENIPKKGAIIFIGNHQNALIDALLIPTTNNRTTYFLTRASAFKIKLIKMLLLSVNMIPIYRIRDGIKTIHKNKEIFEKCTNILMEEKALVIFAEGEHHLKRRVLPLKKGFARIVLATLQKQPDLPIQIIPVGINYDNPINFPCSVSLYYGKPILANEFINCNHIDFKFTHLLNKVHSSLKKLTTHIEDMEHYDELINQLNKKHINFLNPITTNEFIINKKKLNLIKSNNLKKTNWFTPIHFIAKINSILPLLLWKYIKSNIKEEIFNNTYRFALITTLFPLFYLAQSLLVNYFLGLKIAIIYLISSIFLGILITKTTRITQ
jgi:1-acyl-sn-glycerol-3-phosphate acyltransferase